MAFDACISSDNYVKSSFTPDTSVFRHDRISKRRVYLRNFAIVSRVLQVCNLTV